MGNEIEVDEDYDDNDGDEKMDEKEEEKEETLEDIEEASFDSAMCDDEEDDDDDYSAETDTFLLTNKLLKMQLTNFNQTKAIRCVRDVFRRDEDTRSN